MRESYFHFTRFTQAESQPQRESDDYAYPTLDIDDGTVPMGSLRSGLGTD